MVYVIFMWKLKIIIIQFAYLKNKLKIKYQFQWKSLIFLTINIGTQYKL